MDKTMSKLEQLVTLIDRNAQKDGAITAVPDFVLFRDSSGQPRSAQLYQPYILFMAQGEKELIIGGEAYRFRPGEALTLFLPMSLEVERVELPADKPYLMACLQVDLGRIAKILLKLDTLAPPTLSSSALANKATHALGFHFSTLNNHLLDPVIRLLQTLDDPRDVAMLSDSIVDEIYYRLLCDNEVGFGLFRHHLEHRGQIQQIAHSINFIQANLDAVIPIEQLAHISNMGVSSFHRAFKDVVGMTPLQYAKALKLYRAQSLLHKGHTASEAGFAVGYNSPAQFSREYKRFFGFTPSDTRHASC